MKKDDPTAPSPPWTDPSPLLSSTLITFFDPHSHLEFGGCHSWTFDHDGSEVEGTMHLRPGMTIMAGGHHHGRDSSLSSLESWLSEIGSQGFRVLEEPSQQQMPTVTPRQSVDRPPTELVLTKTVDRLQQQQQQQQPKEQETAESFEEGETDAPSWMASPTILACSSPEIQALCSKSSFVASKSEIRLLPLETEDCHGPPSSSYAVAAQPQHKSLVSPSTNSTTDWSGSKSIPAEFVTPAENDNKDASSISSYCYSNEVDRPLHVRAVGECLSKMQVNSNESDTTSSTSATTISLHHSLPPSRPRQTSLGSLPHTATAVRRPSLHRRISFNTLPPMDQVIQQQQPPAPQPRHGSTRSGSFRQVAPDSTTTLPSPRLYQHRRNTTHLSLPSSTYLK